MPPRGLNNGLDLEREKHEIDGTEWLFGASSKTGLAVIPESERIKYLPIGEPQFGIEDFMDCATRGPVNGLEAQFTYLYQNDKLHTANKGWLENNGYIQNNRVVFSDRFIAIKSNTTRQGNSLKGPIDAIHTYGLIPKKLLPREEGMTFAQYHDKMQITAEMTTLGEEFLKRFSINYEQVLESHYETLFANDMLIQAGYAWTKPVNGIYPNPGNLSPNHVWLGIRRPKYVIFDNYLDTDGDWIKVLAPDYNLFDYGYRVFISAETVPLIEEQGSVIIAVFNALANNGLLNFFADWLKNFLNPHPINVLPDSSPSRLQAVAKSFLGKDASPKNLAPQELSCAECVVNIVNSAFPNTLSPSIISTAALFADLKSSPRFVGSLDPIPGCIIVSPRTYSANGHTGIYTGIDTIASNDSRTGLFQENYTRASWRKTFIQGRGLKGYFFIPR